MNAVGEMQRLAKPIARQATGELRRQHRGGSLLEDIVFVATPLVLRHHRHVPVNGPAVMLAEGDVAS